MRAALYSLLLLVVATNTEARPNFLVVLGDDVGWDAFGCTETKEARTPAIDQLARESCMMDRFYCSVSQCAPLRAELYTGLLPNHNGVLANARRVNRPGVKNVADHLRPLGYRVGISGKRHFSLGKSKLDTIPGFPSNANGSNQTHSFKGIRQYITNARNAEESFCVFIGSTHAHHPWDHGDETNFSISGGSLRPHYIDSPSARKAVAKHAAEVEVLDQQIQEIREMMKAMQLEKDTIFIFLSEQGIAMPRGKWSPYEHGSRALCLAHWPAQIPARKTTALAMYCDIVPTLLEFAGVQAPDLDGRSLKSLWTNDNTHSHRQSVLISNVHPFWQKAIVTETYKLIWTGHPEREHIWENFYSKSKLFSQPWMEWRAQAGNDKAAGEKLHRILSPNRLELYDVVSDPYELNNLAKHPAHRRRTEHLHEELKQLMSQCGESLTPVLPRQGKRKNQN